MQVPGHESPRQREGQKPGSDGSLPAMLVKQGQNIWRELSKGESVGDGIVGEVGTSQVT